MATNLRIDASGLIALAAVAPLVWATTYIVTEKFLTPERPTFSALVRALPMGIVLLALRRTMQPADWWGRAVVPGILALVLGGVVFGRFGGRDAVSAGCRHLVRVQASLRCCASPVASGGTS